MKPTVWQRVDVVARQITPFLLTLLVMMLALVPLRIPDFTPVVPWFTLIAVFYWSVHRPDLMPAAAVFALGLFHDFSSGTTLGVGLLILLLVNILMRSQRRFFVSRSFVVVWCGFTLVAMGAAVLLWLLNSILMGVLIDPRPAIFQFFMTIAAYPPLAWLFAQVQRAMLR